MAILPQIFVAYSSYKGEKIFQALNTLFTNGQTKDNTKYNDICTLRPWKNEFEGGARIDRLLDLCQGVCDFFIIIFTEDDLRYKNFNNFTDFDKLRNYFINSGNNNIGDTIDANFKNNLNVLQSLLTGIEKVPRDNCVLEYALGAGVLGVDRVFYFYESNAKCPTDIAGIDGYELNDSTDSTLTESLNKGIKKIISQVVQKRLFFKRPGPTIISKELLMEFERIATFENENGELQTNVNGQLQKISTVTVVSNKPVEADDKQMAQIIVDNIQAGIKYVYVYPADETYAKIATDSIFGMLNATWKKMPDLEDRFNTLRAKISFYLTAKPISFQYCIHDIYSSSKKIYLIWKTEVSQKDEIVKYIDMLRSDQIIAIEKDLLNLDRNYKSDSSILFAIPNTIKRHAILSRIFNIKVDMESYAVRKMYDEFIKKLKAILEDRAKSKDEAEVSNLILSEIEKYT